uniref:Solute carrier family 22 member 15 (inferred by orthology to a human protein) n=1 Tax=Strongyloides venezuelensis TaxID=75913 RepID=A0A0K0F9L5_STRVS
MVTTIKQNWFPEWINTFNILIFLLWQSQSFMATQLIFPIFSNYVSKWRCNGVGNFDKNCTIYNSGCKIEYENNYFYSASVNFGWICSDNSYLITFSSQLQFFGVFLGTIIFGILSDAFGRRNITIINLGMGCFSILISSFIRNPNFFVSSRFLIGFAVGGALNSGVTYCLEVLPSDRRIFVKCFFNWGLSRFILTTICYFFNDYSSVLFICGLIIIPAIVLLIFYFPESPTWYHYKSMEEKMIESEKKIAKFSNLEYVPIQHELITKNESFFELLKKKEIFQRLSVLWCMWFVASLCGYGIDLYSSEISGNLYINQFFFSLTIYSSKLIIPTIDKNYQWFTRRVYHQGAQTVITMCFSILAFLVAIKYNGIVILILNVIGVVFIEFSWDACYLCAVESMPTNVRSSGLGSCSLMARIGSIISPILPLLNSIWSPMTYLIVAGLGSINLLISFLFLNETKNILLDKVHLTEENNIMITTSTEPLSKE